MTKDIGIARGRASKVKLIIMDIDGVLTDGRVIYDATGNIMKCFDVQDGLGICAAKDLGFKLAIISGKSSKANEHRAEVLGVDMLYQGSNDKIAAYKEILKKCAVSDGETCYIGDDLVDIAVMERVGFAASVQNAVDAIKAVSHYISVRSGGRGAVREVIDFILMSQGREEELINLYRN